MSCQYRAVLHEVPLSVSFTLQDLGLPGPEDDVTSLPVREEECYCDICDQTNPEQPVDPLRLVMTLE